jgi:hypothetical protein
MVTFGLSPYSDLGISLVHPTDGGIGPSQAVLRLFTHDHFAVGR